MARLAALVHFAAPFRNCGSEFVLSECMAAAVRAGHEATIFCTHRDSQRNWTGNEPVTEFDGVTIKRIRNVLIGQKAVRQYKPDVVLTHHDHSVFAIKTARLVGARSVLFLHNDMDIAKRPLAAAPDLAVFNSEWVAESLARFGEPKASMIFHPPLTPDRHKVSKTGDAITLCNLNEHKGADLFYDLAARMPEREFLGVVGGHGVQVVKRGLPNVTIAEHDPNMKPVWESTRILLMPSVYESYGLVAVEAGLNGIPTIANPTPGLRENLGTAGLYARRDHVADWVNQIHALDDPQTYADASDSALMVAEDALKKTRHALDQWLQWIGP